jgi:hypothetical protein
VTHRHHLWFRHGLPAGPTTTLGLQFIAPPQVALVGLVVRSSASQLGSVSDAPIPPKATLDGHPQPAMAIRQSGLEREKSGEIPLIRTNPPG